ncbi:RNA polymerase Rpb1 repeat domain protein [Drechmeria coniospora]|uniref:RNA polymerase Rpb1 repeat domain protein n=1 Tax=Drechmeria coniospora TaxID=98403 RepID=A0A151GVW5_DRECN|nr:RNA polymerase Rpb1 repeat domain protein [Drechmeria coniospora]KYK61255.1 RNA polymerase Rpb1 repeat domain protein [Drechmeria coniospora]ODA81017.1 hypothetical protein RJ55_03979 [Drechmeria coniospora]
MKAFATLAAALVGLASVSSCHMEMKDPPPFRSKFNKFSKSADYDMTAPLSAAGGNYPCKGYQSLFGTAEGKPVATWVPGKSYSMTITGGASHGGGSCQAAISLDRGKTFKVIHSFIGNCPGTGESSFQFTLPSDTPSGDMIFAWTWFNQIGNREMYMNCAAITVSGGGDSKIKKVRGLSGPFSSRPNIFVANVANGCTTKEGSDVDFPQPGPDVTKNSQKIVPPTGNCPSEGGTAGGKYPVGGGARQPGNGVENNVSSPNAGNQPQPSRTPQGGYGSQPNGSRVSCGQRGRQA